MHEVTVRQMSDNNFLLHMAGLFYFRSSKIPKMIHTLLQSKTNISTCFVLTQVYFVIVIHDAASDQTRASSAKDLRLLGENYALMNLQAVIWVRTYGQDMLYVCYCLHFCWGIIAINIVTCPDHSTPTVPQGHILSYMASGERLLIVLVYQRVLKNQLKLEICSSFLVTYERIQTWLLHVE